MNDHAKDILHRLLSISTFFETDDDRLTMNISGMHYEINARDLFNFPETILGDPFERVYFLVSRTNEYFIPRHSTSFESILYYYISDGILIKPETIPSIIFHEEIRFFRLNEKLIEIFYRDYLAIHEEKTSSKEDVFQKSKIYFYSLMNTCSAVFNALAIYSLCLETMSIYRNWHQTIWMVKHPLKPANRTEGFQCSDMSLRPYQFIPSPHSENTILELICVTWFYLELFLRTFSTRSLFKLIRDRNILLDILCILPTMINQILYRFYLTLETEETHLFDYVTCLKLFRLFRITRHAKSLKILLEILYINRKDFLRLTILIIFGTFYFGLTQFVLEQLYEDNEIHNIGEALWHGFTVIITIGYSDIAEYQFLSYTFAIVGVWYGAISMAIILPSINQSYYIYRNYQNLRLKIRHREN